jgi:cytochrome b561
MRITAQRYTTVAIILHWLIAAAIITMLGIGLTMMHAPISMATKFRLIQLHKSIGITILGLVILRVLWRLTHKPPPLPAEIPPLERTAAEGTHYLLYVFMIGLPLTGWAMVSSSPINIPTMLYGVVRWPHMSFLETLPNKAAVSGVFNAIHTYGAWTLIVVFGIHALAALRHHFLIHDDVLWRMLPLVHRPSARKSTPNERARMPV